MTEGPGAADAGEAGRRHATAHGDAPVIQYPPIPARALAEFVDRLGHPFRDPGLLGRALTHRSWCAEHSGFESNERLEFLGDSVLGLVVTEEIFSLLPDAGEGHLSRVRAAVVCAPIRFLIS